MKTNANSTATALEATDKAFERMLHKFFGRNETGSNDASNVTGAEIVVDGGATGAPQGAPIYRTE